MYATELVKMRLTMVETKINHSKPGKVKSAVLWFEVMMLTGKLDRLNKEK